LSRVLDKDCSRTIGKRLSLTEIYRMAVEMRDNYRGGSPAQGSLVGVPIGAEGEWVHVVEQDVDTGSIRCGREVITAIRWKGDRSLTDPLCRAKCERECGRPAVRENRTVGVKRGVDPAKNRLSSLAL
jgi:hypothetical protein